jgi:hypothetical protein
MILEYKLFNLKSVVDSRERSSSWFFFGPPGKWKIGRQEIKHVFPSLPTSKLLPLFSHLEGLGALENRFPAQIPQKKEICDHGTFELNLRITSKIVCLPPSKMWKWQLMSIVQHGLLFSE